ncbi:hypothetical protein JG688_00008215 [Phytophthora aleatoria]|uniref:Uncharacterized protein n=1 Tax=Phytophthora aleatoria TaxID=2496075 RepID=A0A8J5IRD7_9STRA|nr:hypothetical protein JG688_00008215 [Phytophthora aleatoria]
MLAYLGIEKDDENDEDFVVNEDGEEGGDSSEESGVKGPPKAGKDFLLQVREKADTGRQRKKPPGDDVKRRYSPYEPSPPPSKKTKMIEKSDAEESDVSAEYAEPNEFPTVAVSNASLREEYEPRRRKSWLLDELKPMESEEDTIVNVVVLFRPSAAIRIWDDFNKHFDIYKKKHNLKFRVRSSERTVLYNT